MKDNISIREWVEKYKDEEFLASGDRSKDIDLAIHSGFYDWFCSDSLLLGKVRKFKPILLALKGSSRVDLDKDYVFFKNNCPVSFNLYDSFSICKLDEGDVRYFIAHKCPYETDENGKAFLWTVSKVEGESYPKDGQDWPTFHFRSTEDLIKFLNDEEK